MNRINRERVAYLLGRIQQITITPEELDELLTILEKDQSADLIAQCRDFFGRFNWQAPALNRKDPVWNSILQQVLSVDYFEEIKVEAPPYAQLRTKPEKWKWRWVAAILLVAVSACWFFIRNNSHEQPDNKLQPDQVNELTAGTNGAILTLADGRQIVLDSVDNGAIASQLDTKLSLLNNQLVYDLPSGAHQHSLDNTVWNTMETPRGRQFQLRLPDGSKVWLNAASSIRYPVAFTGAERKVELSGEAYFEIRKDQARPFKIVTVRGEEIEVLGTRFNINAYSDEPEGRVTLLAGAVQVSNKGGKWLLSPGQQAVSTESGIIVQQADTLKAVAWKNGLFDFNGVGLPEVMRQLSRWYDVEVVFASGVPPVVFQGRVGRDVSLNKLVVFFDESDILVRLEKNNRIVISMP